MGARRLLALIRGLPRDSATLRTVGTPWGFTEELLAILAEQVNWGNLLYHHVHFKGPHPEALKIRRPGEEKKRKTASPEQLAAFAKRRGIKVIAGGKA